MKKRFCFIKLFCSPLLNVQLEPIYCELTSSHMTKCMLQKCVYYSKPVHKQKKKQ